MQEDGNETMDAIEKNQQLARRGLSTEPNGIQLGLLLVYTGISGFGAVFASTLFDNIVYRIAAGANGFLLTFGVLVLFGLLVLDDREVDDE